MTKRIEPAALLAAGLLLGVLGNVLLRSGEAPGLNLFLWSAGVCAAAVVLHHRAGVPLSGEARLLLGTGVVLSLGLVWRDSDALKLLLIGSTVVAYSLPAFRSGAAWVRRSSVGEYLTALFHTGLFGAVGAPLTLTEVDWDRHDEGRRTQWHTVTSAARGLVLAVPMVIVFGALFMSADAVFAHMVTDVVRLDPELLASHVVLTGVLAWLATGYLRSFVVPREPRQVPPALGAARLGVIEGGVLLVLLNVLFLTFVLVQFRYLFGGAALVEVTPGLTYAEYARRGFFELVVVVALMVPLLLSLDWLLRDATARGRIMFRTLGASQLVLLLAIMASAVQRMRMYQEAYGLTEQRVYATALLGLLGVVLVLFAATVLRERRESFAFGALAASFLTVAVLVMVNPDALIARTNIERMRSDLASGVPAEARFDGAYAAGLSGDAVPVLLAHLHELPHSARCAIAPRVLRRFGPDQPLPLRSWNWSAARARVAVQHNAAALRSLAADAGCNTT